MQYVDLQERIKKYAKENGVKLSYIAEQVGLHQSQLSAWLHGKKDIDKFRVHKLECFLEKVGQ